MKKNSEKRKRQPAPLRFRFRAGWMLSRYLSSAVSYSITVSSTFLLSLASLISLWAGRRRARVCFSPAL